MSQSSEVSPELIAAMKEELERKRASLSKSIRSELDDMSSGEGRHLADMGESGDANDEEASFRILEIEGAELAQIDTALERIKEGTYGACADCEEPVGLERLKALPFANVCISCQRVREQEAR